MFKKKNLYKIFCDLDGTLSNFDKRYKELTGYSPTTYRQKFGKTSFWDVIDKKHKEQFWSEMEWLEDGPILWDYIKKYNPTIITAPSPDISSKFGKRKWLENHLPNSPFIICPRQEKQLYSKHNHILIDDHSENIKEWSAQGGIGILHSDAKSTIEHLKKLGI
jgi:hypothetical protein